MKKIISCLAASFLLAACGNASTNDKTNTNNTQPKLTETKLQINWTKAAKPGSNSFTMDLSNYEDASNFRVVPFMPSMNHGSYSEFLKIEKNSSTLQVEGLNFSMPGDWTVEVSFDSKGKRISHKEEVFVTAPKEITAQFVREASLSWIKGPKAGTNSFKVILTGLEGYKLSEVVPFMPSMGHGSYSENLMIKRVSADTFLVTGLYLSMRGEWDINLKLLKAGEEYLQTITVTAK